MDGDRTYEVCSCIPGFHVYQNVWTPVLGESPTVRGRLITYMTVMQ